MKTSIALALALLCGAAAAQSVYRCGSSYSDTPCPRSQPVAVADQPSRADHEAALEVAARDQALAHALVQEREQREREQRARGPGITSLGGAPKAAPAVKPKKPAPKPLSALRGTSRATLPSIR